MKGLVLVSQSFVRRGSPIGTICLRYGLLRVVNAIPKFINDVVLRLYYYGEYLPFNRMPSLASDKLSKIKLLIYNFNKD